MRLDSFAAATAPGERWAGYRSWRCGEEHVLFAHAFSCGSRTIMPPDGPPLDEIANQPRLKEWIEEGAKWPDSDEARSATAHRFRQARAANPGNELCRVSFGRQSGRRLDLSTRETAFESGEQSAIHRAVQAASRARCISSRSLPERMTDVDAADQARRPARQRRSTETLRLWISQGAIWPKDIVLKTRAKNTSGPSYARRHGVGSKNPCNRSWSKSKLEQEAELANYAAEGSANRVPYQMVAIKGGEFLMGSPSSEKGRQDIEGPQARWKSRRSGSASTK